MNFTVTSVAFYSKKQFHLGEIKFKILIDSLYRNVIQLMLKPLGANFFYICKNYQSHKNYTLNDLHGFFTCSRLTDFETMIYVFYIKLKPLPSACI